jgi:predicted amidohydrolase
MRIAVVQTDPVFGEIEKNVQNALALMQSAEADLYVLPELFNTGYNFVDAEEANRLSESTSGYTFEEIAAFARRQSCYVVYGFVENTLKLYNSASLVGPYGMMGLYRKVHLFNRENLFFAPGDLGFPVFNLPIGKIGIMICFDWYYPESARTLALKGAQIVCHPSNLVLPHCPDAMVTRCLENHIFAATSNRIGVEDRGGVEFSFIGKSEIVTPKGEIVQRLGSEAPGIAVAEVDLHDADNKQLNQFNNLIAGRRPSQYSL